jgi:NAD(P)-dependent dehydrogenase (short-subunit alcohol dehydrogenase family)
VQRRRPRGRPDPQRPGRHAPEVREALLEKTALPRLGEPEDLASVLAFLLSAESGWITGQILSVDGGLTMRE